MCVFVYIYIYICIYICVHTYIHTYTHTKITVSKSINPNAATTRKSDGIYFNINARKIHIRVLRSK